MVEHQQEEGIIQHLDRIRMIQSVKVLNLIMVNSFIEEVWKEKMKWEN
jgi:hypothetical protein